VKRQRFNNRYALPMLLAGFVCVIAYGLLGGDSLAARLFLGAGIVLGIAGALYERRDTPRR